MLAAKIDKKVSQNLQNITNMAPKVDPKAMKNRGCVEDAFLERFWTALGRQMLTAPDAFGILLATVFAQKSKKWHPKKRPKIDAEKVSKIDAKRLPK